MAITFPSIEPTGRSFVAPRWPTTSLVSQSGVKTSRLWGSRPSQALLRLTFENVTDDNAATIIGAYNSAKGSSTELILPDVIFNGSSADLKGWLDTSSTGAGMQWFFSEEPPTVESVSPNRSTVAVQLVAELRRTIVE